MSVAEIYQPLIKLAAAIESYEEQLKGSLDRREKRKLEESRQKLQQKFNDDTEALVKSSVDNFTGDKPLSVIIGGHLNEIYDIADTSWSSAISMVRQRMVSLADREAQKSPTRRKLERNAWWLGILTVAAIAGGLKVYWLVPVTADSESVVGVIERSAAYEKVLDYDDAMETRVRRGGWAKSIVMWPISATDSEVEYAQEFVSLSYSVYDYLIGEGFTCKSGSMGREHLTAASAVLGYINSNPSTTGFTSGYELALEGLIESGTCTARD